jgi:anti-anti-sigma regulatory factor
VSRDGDNVPGGPFEVVQGADEDRIVVRADLDLSLAEPLRARAMALLEGGAGRRLTIDLTATPFLDSSGVQALVRLAGAAGRTGFRVIAGGQPYQVLELTEVLKLLAVERSDAR